MGTKIQCFIRAYFARELLKGLQEEKQTATLLRNQMVRFHVMRCRRRKRIKLEHSTAVICQSVVRMFIARQAVQLRRRQHLFELNQYRWRAVSIRLAWALVRINAAARTIQCIVRRKLSQRRVSHIFEWYTQAAV